LSHESAHWGFLGTSRCVPGEAELTGRSRLTQPLGFVSDCRPRRVSTSRFIRASISRCFLIRNPLNVTFLSAITHLLVYQSLLLIRSSSLFLLFVMCLPSNYDQHRHLKASSYIRAHIYYIRRRSHPTLGLFRESDRARRPWCARVTAKVWICDTRDNSISAITVCVHLYCLC
jgi:hypothetical protein